MVNRLFKGKRTYKVKILTGRINLKKCNALTTQTLWTSSDNSIALEEDTLLQVHTSNGDTNPLPGHTSNSDTLILCQDTPAMVTHSSSARTHQQWWHSFLPGHTSNYACTYMHEYRDAHWQCHVYSKLSHTVGYNRSRNEAPCVQCTE